MTKLVWGPVGERYFEAGVDRGVLYIDTIGFAWNGLKAVNEAPTGGEPKPFYIDGYKYLNLATREEFEATIEAFSAPAQFDACDGSMTLLAGLSLTQQPRKSFGLTYRTKIGNDVLGSDFAYKIHLVYNAVARPSSRSNNTIGANADPTSLSWSISTTPPYNVGIIPTAHLVIDSRTTPPLKLAAVEDFIYGSGLANAKLPTLTELIGLMV